MDTVLQLQKQLQATSIDEGDTTIPETAQRTLHAFKQATTLAFDTFFRCTASSSSDPTILETQLATRLYANAPAPSNGVMNATDPGNEEVAGSYGHNLRISLHRLSSELIAAEISINIECGNDTQLLLYELRDGGWIRRLRWQADNPQKTSDAFGDFFLYRLLPSPSQGEPWRLVIARGAPWCTSRFSLFRMELLSPSQNADAPNLLWHSENGYSRGDFEPRLKASADTFELRINRPSLDTDGYETRAIYRYHIHDNDQVDRIGPLGIHACGFIEAWINAPWNEAHAFVTPEAQTTLHAMHDQLNPPSPRSTTTAISNGPVRACSTASVFQAQIHWETRQDAKTKTSAELYFHLREVKDGYLIFGASTTADAQCKGSDLMHTQQ